VRCVVALVIAMATVDVVEVQPGDWTVRRDPFDRGVIARYQAILARDPHDPSLAKLAQLYRTYRKLSHLIEEYDAKLAAAPDSWALLIVTSRLLELDGQREQALALYRRAWSAKPEDARLAIRIATLARTLRKPEDARFAFEQAAKHGDRKLQREALKALLEIARTGLDRIEQVTLAKRLSDLDPADPQLQLERGDALLAIDLVDGALEAYATAERLYATDPWRKVDAIARRGLALEKRSRADAETEYRRAIASVPKDHDLRAELFARIVELHRKAGTLGSLLAVCLVDWPERSRGVFEWYELAKLHDAVGEAARSISALEKVVARSPDPRRHLELADRYAADRRRDALALLDKVAARFPRDPGILISVAERNARWGRVGIAITMYDRVLRLDPTAEERMIDLVEDLFRKGEAAAGVAAARSIVGKVRTAPNHGRLGTVLLEFGQYALANDAFGRAIELEKTNPAWWRGRAAARDAAGHRAIAIDDTWGAIAVATDTKVRRMARREMARIVMQLDSDSGLRRRYLDDWRKRFAGDPPNLDAGFLLLTYFEMSPCDLHQAISNSCEHEVIRVLEKLSEHTTLDVADVVSLATAYSAAQLHDEAVAIIRKLQVLEPAHRAELEGVLARVDDWSRRSSDPSRSWSTEVIEDPERELRDLRQLAKTRTAIAAPLRVALRIGAGNGLRGSTDQAMSAGVMASALLGSNVSVTGRVDWARYDGEVSFETIGGSIGIAKALLPTRHTVFVFGIAERLEHRQGAGMERAGYGPIGLAAEATLDVVGRRVPASAGFRLQQGLSDEGRETALLFELGIELR
jgi:tetratricopeptide (TPR) repeat protein